MRLAPQEAQIGSRVQTRNRYTSSRTQRDQVHLGCFDVVPFCGVYRVCTAPSQYDLIAGQLR